MILIRSATLVTDGEVHERTDVRIDGGGRIAEVGRDLHGAEGEREIDGAGHTLIPGLIDCHVHITYAGLPDGSAQHGETAVFAALRGAHNARRTLEAGFTTVRSLGGVAGAEIAVARAQRQGLFTGSRVIASGQILCMTGGHGHHNGREIDGADDARKAAREQLKQGAQVIKLIATGGILTDGVEPGNAQLSMEEMRAAVEEAHKAGRRTAAHAQGAAGIENALRAGIDSIEHGIFLQEEQMDFMVANGVYLCPTLSASDRILHHGEAGGVPAYAVRKAKEVAETRRRTIHRAIEKKVRFALGTDAGTPYNLHGENARELSLLAGYGIPALDVLRIATANATANVGMEGQIGRIRPGYLADLVLVEGDLLSDLGLLTTSIRAVLQSGRVVAGPLSSE